jgi:tetratricopeptide (TPR) repeat protein
MGARRNPDSWLEDFSLVLTPRAIRSHRRDPKYEVFAGSKPVAFLWLTFVSLVAGAFGALLVSAALWRQFWQLPVWPVAFVAFCFLAYRSARAFSGSYLAFLTAWCIGWGTVIGACAMGAAQLASSGWTYGIAAGLGFLIGIVEGVYEPEDLESHEGFFALGMVLAPAGACLAAWLFRNALTDPSTLQAAAFTGAVAGLVFLAPTMLLLLVGLKNADGLKRLATLLLHNDETVAEALPLLDAAIELSPNSGELLERRALAYALLGRETEAEADWRRHADLGCINPAREVAQGWVQLRRGQPGDAALWFEQALAKRRREGWALVGLAVARLQLGDAAGAITMLEAIPEHSRDALNLTYLAEAYLAVGNNERAVQLASDAIDELDSIHGRSWIVRGDAFRAMGDRPGAGHNYSRALWADDEEGVEERAMARLEEIDWPVEEDEPD